MFGIGMPELLVILVVALVVLGPKRLPEVARALGKAMAEFRRQTADVMDEFQVQAMLEVSFIAALFAASPIIFFQAWRFVAPGLYDSEKRLAFPFAIAASFFFVVGASFCYWLVFPVGFRFFLAEYQSISVAPQIRISEYLTFASRMLLAFGITFELPVVTFFLARVGVVTHRMLLGTWRYATVVIFIVAAVLTPGPDVASQLLMATPLLVLYWLSIGVAWLVARPAPAAVPAGSEG